MKYKITSNYCYHNGIIVDMYFINGIPFTFDDVPQIIQDDPYVKIEAEGMYDYTSEDLYAWSDYLIMEECHPLMFELELENPEALPQD
jgi:hypothetical protein